MLYQSLTSKIRHTIDGISPAWVFAWRIKYRLLIVSGCTAILEVRLCHARHNQRHIGNRQWDHAKRSLPLLFR